MIVFLELKVEGCEVSAAVRCELCACFKVVGVLPDQATIVLPKAARIEALGSLSIKTTWLNSVENKWHHSCTRRPRNGRTPTFLLTQSSLESGWT